jgi:glutathione synthase
LGDLDIVFLRNDPSTEPSEREWARNAPILFTRAALKEGVLVVNSPNGLGRAFNKMYYQEFPDVVRPQTLVTRNRSEIKSFARELGRIIIKPLFGSGGTNVFMVRKGDIANLNQMIDAIVRDGFVVCQEYIPAAEKGDIRLFLMNGEPLLYQGKYAALHRVRSGGDIRSNMHVGGKSVGAHIGGTELWLAEIVRPKLVEDGMFLVGLDIAGDKLIEINVFSPGGLWGASRLEGVNFADPVIDALERKAKYMQYYHRRFNNEEIAVL